MRIGAPAADFDHPLEMLEACHDRIEDRLEMLQRLCAHLADHGCDDQARQAAMNVMRYFDTAGEQHHEDEERDLFPMLALTDAGEALARLLDALRRDHQCMREAWKALRSQLTAIVDGSAAARLDAASVRDFVELYRAHIEREESELLPRAAAMLGADQMAGLGLAMARRRGVKR